jgi:serine/threonine-protein kinase
VATTRNLERYRTISTLGAGGMATVVLAEDTVLGRQVALKRVATEGDVRALSRLRREALVGASLSHQSLVAVYDVITTGSGDAVIVMEYVPGETLRERLGRQGRLAPAEALSILAGVAAGLDAIHSRHIVHRDVKPANVLLGPEGVVKLADLGIAAAADRTRITTAGTLLGSFRYMAPEQMEGAAASPAIDIYGLAAVAFETLSGKRARDEANPVALAHAISTQPPPNLQDAWPAAPAAAAEVLSRAMSRDPAERPRSAGDLIAQLSAAFDSEPTVAAAPTPQPAAGEPVPSAVPVSAKREPPSLMLGGTGRPVAVRGRALPAVLLVLVAAVVIVLVLQGGGSRSRRAGVAGSHHRRHPARPASAAGKASSAGKASTAGKASGAGRASGAAGSASSGSSQAATPAPTPPAATSPAATPPSAALPAGASTPASAVESFYHLAASHRYAEAWALADPTFRAQLAGYDSFQAGQSGDRSITFHQARVITQTSSNATVAVSTTSVRTDGTQQCSGTVALVRGTSSWLLHRIQITCA